MSNADGKQPDPNELNLPGDEEQLEDIEELDFPDSDASDPLSDLGGLELPDGSDPLAGAGLPGEDAAPILGSSDQGVDEVPDATGALESLDEEAGGEVDEVDEETSDADEEEQAPAREGVGLAGMGVFGVCGLSIVLLVALDAMVFRNWGVLFMLLMNVFWLLATAIPFIMWMGRKTLSFYEVILGISLAAIIVSVALLLVELVDYQGEVTPKGGTATAVQLGADSTITVA